MRILIPTMDYPPATGGIARITLELSRELAAMGHVVSIVAPRAPGMAALDRAEAAQIIRFAGRRRGCFCFLPLCWKTWRLAGRADLILAISGVYGGIIARGARLLRGTPYLVFAHADECLRYRRAPIMRGLLRSVYRRANATVALNRHARRNLELFGVPERDIALIPPGARLAEPLPETAIHAVRERFEIGNGRMVLAVGHFVSRRNHLTLVKAMPQVLERHPNTHLVMAGQGPCLEECREKARALGIEGQVHCPGHVDEATLETLYQACDVFVQPFGENAWDTDLGLAVTEACARGKPVVAGRAGGIPDVVVDRQTGFLVASEKPDALAAPVVAILDDAALAKRLGEAGRRRVEEELNWRVFAEKVIAAASRKGGATAP